MQNSNEQMRRDFEEACQKAGLNPARRTLGGRYALDIVEHMWLGYQLSHTSAAEKHKGVVEALERIAAGKYPDERVPSCYTRLWRSDMMAAAQQALAALEQE